MFDKLIDFLISIIDLFRFFDVVDQWENGVRLHFGRHDGKILTSENGVFKTGFHFMAPFKISKILSIGVKPEVAELDPQTVTTSDNVVISVQAVVKYEVKDPAKALLEVGDEVLAVKELTQGFIRTILIKTPYSDCNSTAVVDEITKLSKKEARRWGIELMSVTIKTLGKMTSIRLMQDVNSVYIR